MEAMLPDGCRLCLDPFAENASSLENPELKLQLQTVFHFTIEAKHGYSSSVCQSCSYIISEFYRYSEKVRLNQKHLNDETLLLSDDGPKLNFEELKTESTESLLNSDCNQLATELKESKEEEFSDGEIFGEPYEQPVKRPRKKRKNTIVPRRKRTKSHSQEDEEQKTKRKYDVKSKQEQEREDKLINEFFRMVCDLCGDVAPNFPSLDSHYRENHGRSGYIRCCKKKLSKRCFLLQHMTLHTNPNAFRCEVCSKNYKSKLNLSMHLTKVHGSEEERPFKCDRCTQSYAKQYMLRGHLASHEKVQCPKCDRLLASRAALSVHLTNMHSDTDRRMICDSCGQEFLNKACFERHVKEHAGIEVMKKLQCHICQKWLMGERGLQKHLQFTHSEREQTHICDICQQHYPNSRALWSHKRIVHVEEKFECEFCGKKFKRAINLKEHRTIHTGEVLYSCEVCGVTMNSKANLYTHTKKNHPVEWAEKKLKAAEANIPKVQA